MELLLNLISYFIVNLNECSKRIKYSQNILKMKNLLRQTNINENKNSNNDIFNDLNSGVFKSYEYNQNVINNNNTKKIITEKTLVSDSKIDINEVQDNLRKKIKNKKKKKKLSNSMNVDNSDNLNDFSNDLSPISSYKKKNNQIKNDNDDFNINPLNFSSMTTTYYNNFNNNLGSRQRAVNFSNKIRTPQIRPKSHLNKNIGKFTNSNWINTLSNLTYFKK